MIDCGTVAAAAAIRATVREHFPDARAKPLHTVIYTHGHLDHCMLNHSGFDAEPLAGATRVVAHANVVPRFDRYKATAGYNTHINRRQFQLPRAFRWPTDTLRYPDLAYTGAMTRLVVGGEHFELHHFEGETDDATVVWMPRLRYAFVGDFFIWNAPNCGNPQKVQRYPLEWARALKAVASWEPTAMFPGHGPPVLGAERVQTALRETAAFLDVVNAHAMAGINAGTPLAEIMRSLAVPRALLARPYLRPHYDDPRFICATLWRRYCGWYDFDVPRLLPMASAARVGAEICRAAGVSPLALATRAEALAAEAAALADAARRRAAALFDAVVVAEGDDGVGDTVNLNNPAMERLAVALQLAEYAAAAVDAGKGGGGLSREDAARVHAIRAAVLRAKQANEPCLMSSSIYKAAARDSDQARAAALKAKL